MSNQDEDEKGVVESAESIASRLETETRRIIDLDEILISQTVYNQWHLIAQKALTKLPARVDPTAIGDEMAEIQPDGSLVIFACYKEKSSNQSQRRLAELKIDAKQWAWRFPKN